MGKIYIINIFFFIIYILISCNSLDDFDKDQINNLNEENCSICDQKTYQININTNGQDIVDEPKIRSSINIIKNDSLIYSGIIGIEIRGESSQYFDKKSYGFETWNDNNEDIDVSLLGFPEEEDWILHGPFSDKSLIRNMLIYELSNSIGRYASRTEFVELSINSQYKGLYIFMEKLKRDKNRINISKLEENDTEEDKISGGYIIKIDKSDMEDGSYTELNSFKSEYDVFGNKNNSNIVYFNYEYPKPSLINYKQKEYIKNYINEFEESLSSDQFQDPILGFRKYIDDESFIDFFILNELSNNIDGYRLSTYLHKDRDQKLKIGPIWDFNLSFGNADYCGGERYDVWCYKFNDRCLGDRWNIPFWWNRLLEDENFVIKLKNRWIDLRGGILSDNNILSIVDEKYSFLKNESNIANNNFNKWKIFGIYIWPNSFIGNNYYEEIDFLKTWIKNRTKWLDESISKL